MPKHVVIIGGGVIGLCSAYYARLQGDEVTVVDDRPDGHAGCSLGNAGMIVPSHIIPLAAPGMVAFGLKCMANPESPFYIRPRLSWDLLTWGLQFWKASTAERVRRASPLFATLGLRSRKLYEELADDGLEFGLVRRGLLMLCQTQHALDDEAKVAALANSLEIPTDVLDREQTLRLDPTVQMDVCGSVHFRLDAHFSPMAFMAALEERLRSSGVQILRGRQVKGIRQAGRRLHSIDAGDPIDGDEFVLAAGSWSTGLGQQLGLSLPIQPGKGYSLTLPRPRQLPELCSILTEARVAVTPMNGSLRVGGTMELSGLDESIQKRRVQGIVRSFVKYFPAFQEDDFAGLTPWAGLRPVSPDGLPYIGRPARFDNVVVATGHAMMGMSLAPITGKLVAELLQNRRPSIDLTLLSPDRFS